MHVEAKLADVAKHFVKDYNLPSTHVLVQHEMFFDPVKGVFIFKLFISPKD